MDELQSSNNDVTKVDIYQPTPAEIKLMEVLLNPEHRMKSVTDICKTANISRQHYYNIVKKQEFNELCKQTATDLVKAEILPLIYTGIKEAKRGSFQHWKVLMEMAGLYSEKQNMQVNVTFEQLLKKALESGE
ncbi:MAG: phBC6A51 family helix-turn-helix protein [Clostridia bacterium]